MYAQIRLIGLLLFALPGIAAAQVSPCQARSNNTFEKLLACVTLDGVRAHQAAFQAIADAHGGTRVTGTPGYQASVDYVVEKMTAAGYAVTVQPFQVNAFVTLSPTVLEQVAPPPAGPITNTILSYSGSGDVTASVTTLPAPPADATPGCDAADFAGFPAGDIVLVSRGGCTFAIKATNAYSAGASGVVIYNNVPGTLSGTLGTDFTLDIGVTSVTQAVGFELAATPGLVMRLKTDTLRGPSTSYNVLAESQGGDPDNVIMVGAHLDSVNEGPGINDNGSGAAAILETALQMAMVTPRNKVRFAWWGAHEAGVAGSNFYAFGLAEAERARIALYLDAHALGSPNPVFFVLDGDDSSGLGFSPPEGSAAIEATFRQYFAGRGVPVKEPGTLSSSDYLGFADKGIPVGGINAGTVGIKTPDEAATWGGVAGEQYDPCYHLACDTFDNVNLFALDVNADAIAYATLRYAMSTEDVNGLRGKGNFGTGKGKPAPASTAAVEY
jgi:Zn-dependent M28 family amino/carboxypeptidase